MYLRKRIHVESMRISRFLLINSPIAIYRPSVWHTARLYSTATGWLYPKSKDDSFRSRSLINAVDHLMYDLSCGRTCDRERWTYNFFRLFVGFYGRYTISSKFRLLWTFCVGCPWKSDDNFLETLECHSSLTVYRNPMLIFYRFVVALLYGHRKDIYVLLFTLSTLAFYTFLADCPWKVLRWFCVGVSLPFFSIASK